MQAGEAHGVSSTLAGTASSTGAGTTQPVHAVSHRGDRRAGDEDSEQRDEEREEDGAKHCEVTGMTVHEQRRCRSGGDEMLLER